MKRLSILLQPIEVEFAFNWQLVLCESSQLTERHGTSQTGTSRQLILQFGACAEAQVLTGN